jgi:hypothetical protein
VPVTPAELEDALAQLLAEGERSGDVYADTVAGVKRALERRKSNTRHGGVAIEALRDRGLTWRQIKTATGVDKETARRWALPPSTEDES